MFILEFKRQIDAVRTYYWWHDIKQDVTEVVKGCPFCNARNPIRGASKTLLDQEERTAIPWEELVLTWQSQVMDNNCNN